MPEKQARIPGPDHPITIASHTGRVTVKSAGKTIADSTRALSLREASYPPVFYIPREDADMSLLTRSSHTTYCPYKGDCSYYSLDGIENGANAVWTYETPYDAVHQIKNHLAFYPDRVEIAAD